MGGGSFDFKFSHGYRSRVIVEIKKSTGTVKHGYEKQLETYKTASRTDKGMYIVIKYGSMEKK